MFSKLPDLFDRNFAMGFFLPIAVFLSASLELFNRLSIFKDIATVNSANNIDLLAGTTVIGLISWLGGVFLLALNRNILRLMEGYLLHNRFNGKFDWLNVLQIRRYRKMKSEIEQLNSIYLKFSTNGEKIPISTLNNRSRLLRKIREEFPDDERWILPTSFGNIIRAFEAYPRLMYGIDPITGWNRLLTVMPSDYRALVDNAKSQVDFWSNIWLLSIVIFIEQIVFSSVYSQLSLSWHLLLYAFITAFAFHQAKTAALEWGDFVKSSFDVFLPELRKKMKFEQAQGLEEEKSQWRSFSQSIIYGEPDYLPDRSYSDSDEDPS